jgi:hypothetical protein
MRFLLDENVPPAVADVLTLKGHDVQTIHRTAYEGSPDSFIWSLAAQDERILVTRDLDFPLEETPAPPGLLLMRLPHWFLSPRLAEFVEQWFESNDPQVLLGRVTVITAAGARSRTLFSDA